MEHSSKELPFLDILIKTEMAESSQISTTDTQQYIHFNRHPHPICIISIPYILERRVYTIIID